MNKEDTKQAIFGFTEFFKGITGNQDVKIPDDIAKKYEIEQTRCKDVDVLDKLRAEIISRDRNVKTIRNDGCCFFTAEEVLQIIDKYKTESEK